MVAIPILTDQSAVRGPKQGTWTVDEWETLPHDEARYEIINGVLYMSKSPSFFHQWMIFRFVALLGTPFYERGLGFAVFAPVGVFMPGCDPVQPDFLLIKTEHKEIIRDRRIYGVPDLIIEVLSPSNSDYDEDIKRAAYQSAGVPEYGVLDAAARQLRLYVLQPDKNYAAPRIYNPDDTVMFACAPDIPVLISSLFDGAPDTTL